MNYNNTQIRYMVSKICICLDCDKRTTIWSSDSIKRCSFCKSKNIMTYKDWIELKRTLKKGKVFQI